MAFADAAAARAYLQRLGQDPPTMATLRRVLANAGGVVPAGTTDVQVIELLSQRLHQGQLYLLDHGERRALPGPAKAPVKKAKAATPPAAKPKYWIKFKLVDDVTGAPLPNVRMQVRLPNNSLVNRTTNAQGLVFIEGLNAAGNCKVEAITDDASLAVTKVQ